MDQGFFSLLRLESRFPRPVGDAANPASHAFPVRICIVDEASVARVVYGLGESSADDLIERFVVAARREIRAGARMVGTSCGFLAEHQEAMARQLDVPFISSALIALPDFTRNLETRLGRVPRIGVLTFDESVLLAAPWFAALAERQISVAGLAHDSHLYRVIRDDLEALDPHKALESVLASAKVLRQSEPDGILFECTNLGPYKTEVSQLCGCPVLDYNEVMAEAWKRLPAI